MFDSVQHRLLQSCILALEPRELYSADEKSQAQLEGKPGSFSAEGVFALEPFFAAAQAAGIYLIARPGPYINAEATGGGFPGWLQRASAVGRTQDFLPYTEDYVKGIGPIIAKGQIT